MTDFEYRKLCEAKLEKNPKDVDALIELGYLYFVDCEDRDKALQLLKHAIKLDPNNAEAYYWLAKSYNHNFFDEEKTKEALEKALLIDPNRADCQLMLLGFLEDQGMKYNRLIQELKRLIKHEPTWMYLRTTLTYHLLEKNKFDEAKQVAKEARQVFKKMKLPTPTTPREEYYEECVRGRTKQIVKHLDELFEDIEEARLEHKNLLKNINRVKMLDKKLKNNPANFYAVKEKWFLCTYKIHKPEEAESALEEALEKEPNNIDFLYWLAQALYKQKKNDGVQAVITKALSIDPDRADRHCLLAKAAIDFCSEYEDDPLSNSIHKHDAKITIPHLEAAIKLEPTWILPRIDLIKCYLYPLMAINFRKAESLILETEKEVKYLTFQTPQNIFEKHHERLVTGRAQSSKDFFKKLKYFVEDILELREKMRQLLAFKGFFALTDEKEKERYNQKAKLDKKIEKDPNNLDTIINYAFLTFSLRGLSVNEALECTRRGVRLNPNNSDALFAFANTLYLKENNYVSLSKQESLDVKASLNKALKIDPNRADCYSILAELARSEKNGLEKTINLLEKSIELEPTWILPRIKLSYYLIEKGNIDSAEAVAKEAFKLFKTMEFPKPKTATEQYYEEAVTGRTKEREQVSFIKLFKLIKEQKAT